MFTTFGEATWAYFLHMPSTVKEDVEFGFFIFECFGEFFFDIFLYIINLRHNVPFGQIHRCGVFPLGCAFS